MVRRVRIYTKYRRPTRRGRRRSRSGLYWLLSVVGLGLIGWIVWHHDWSGEVGPTVPGEQAGQTKPVPVIPIPVIPIRTNEPVVAVAPTNPVPVVVVTSPPPPVVGPPPAPVRPVHNLFEAQILLARQGISPGSIDGVPGSQTRAALRAFQEREGLPPTGELDAVTRFRLRIDFPPLLPYTVTEEDLAGLHPVSKTWLGKSLQGRLGFENLLELVAERSRSHPNLIRRLNPDFDWTNTVAGAVVQVPNVGPLPPARPANVIRIRLRARVLQVYDERANLLAHYPCSIAARVDKRPVGRLHVVVCAPEPNYTFNPEVFPESAEGRELGRKLVLPPGPNNPVGLAWIGLDRPGYGIHGTPRPEEVGRTESHGCFRLANWNALHLLRMVQVGTPVVVEP